MSFHEINLDLNTVIRVATKTDKLQILSLWKECFPEESDNFTAWIFNERFEKFPEYCVCIEHKGEIICSMQSYPLTMKIREANVSAAIVGGVSTSPKFRAKGYMKKMFTYYMNYIRTLGVAIVTYKPVDLNVYKGLTHYPVTDTAYFEIQNTKKTVDSFENKNININENLEALFECYKHFTETKNHSCIINRTLNDFCLKMSDYLSDTMSCIANYKDDEIVGYAIFKYEKNKIHIEEFISNSYNRYNNILSTLSSYKDISTIYGKMPPDVVPFINIDCFTYKISFQNLAGAVNVAELLNCVTVEKDMQLFINVTDDFVSENNNTFDLFGNKRNDMKADFIINSGNLVQLLCGYKTFYQLLREGCIIINNENIYQKTDEIFPRINCFIVDEY